MSTTNTEFGFDTWLPVPEKDRKGIAICFSGGGYRAALFHLGAIRRLNEIGALSKVTTITSVSGGSIFAAQIAGALRENGGVWEPGKPIPGFDEWIAKRTCELAKRDIRSKAVLSRYLKPWNWFKQNAQIDVLAETLADGPAGGKLTDLPKNPRFVFCSTDVRFRDQWTFDTGTGQMGGDVAGHAPLGDWTIARAAASSSCLPVAFAPMRVHADLAPGTYIGSDRKELVGKIDLTDGGIYDNLGLEPVWRDHEIILISDAAPVFKPEPHIGKVWSQLRFIVTLLEQATDVRKRWLITSFIRGELKGTYWGIGSKPENYELAGATHYTDSLIADYISQMRIDLDPFSEGEQAVLQNHGYLITEIAIQKHVPALAGGPAAKPPFPEWMDEGKVRKALRDSHKTKIFARSWQK